MTDDVNVSSRRAVLGAAAAAGAGVGLAVAGAAAAQTSKLSARALNPAAKAVLPDGSALDRKAVLSRLGLDPSTPPDAWLAIVACGSNASALKPGELQSLVDRKVLNLKTLDAASQAKLKAGHP